MWDPIGSLTGPEGPQGSPGDEGPEGPEGPKGDPGDPATATTDASDLTSGTMDLARLPSQVPAYRTSGGAVRSTGAPIRFGMDSDYSAFPGATMLPDGRLLMVWRHGTDHVVARDGSIQGTWSSDEGRTWTDPETLVPYPGGGVDLRDPSVSTSADGTRVWLTYFKGTSSLAAAGCFMRTSLDGGETWGSETRIDPSQPYAAICAPIVEVGSTLFAVWYGRTGSETRDSVWVASSTNNGSSWGSPTRVMNGQTASRDYQEPYLIQAGSDLVLMFRWGSVESLGLSRSTNNGSSWSTGASMFAGTGRPTLGYMSTGVLVCSYRRQSDGAAIYRYSRNAGVSWSGAFKAQLVPGSGWMNYSTMVEVSPGLMFHPVTADEGPDSKVWLSYLSDGGGVSPVGDNFPDRISRVAQDLDTVLAADDFDRPNTTSGLGDCLTGQPWSAGGRILNGEARCAVPNNVVEFPVVETYSPHVTVEADFLYVNDPGFAIMLRHLNDNNHHMFTVETGGTRVRFYVRNNGTYHSLAEATTVPALQGSWMRLTASIRGNRFLGFVNGQIAVAQTIAPVDMNLVGSATRHGLKFNENAANNVHACRRFIVRS